MSDQNVDIDILDSTIDDLADYQGFDVPRGDYKCQFSYETCLIGNDKLPAVRAKFKILEVLELADKEAQPPKEGREVAVVYILRNKDGEKLEISEGQLKKDLLIPLKEATGGDKVSEILANGDGSVVHVTFGVKVNKNDPDQKNNTIKALVVAS